MGPQHPSTHGVLRLELRTDGEVVRAARPHIGYLHRCFEKHAENVDYPGVIPYTDRMDYVASMGNTLGYALAVEKLLGIEAAPYVQTHPRAHGRAAADRLARGRGRHLRHGHRRLHAVPAPAARPREDPRPVRVDLRRAAALQLQLGRRREPRPARRASCAPRATSCASSTPSRSRAASTSIINNASSSSAPRASACCSPELAISYDLTGPNLRGSGVARDLRKDEPYSGYEGYDFEVPVGKGEYGPLGSCFDRNWVRVVEMRESAKIVHQALDRLEKMEKTDVHEKVPKRVKPPKGEVYFRSEAPRGQLGFYVVSDGRHQPVPPEGEEPVLHGDERLPPPGAGHDDRRRHRAHRQPRHRARGDRPLRG